MFYVIQNVTASAFSSRNQVNLVSTLPTAIRRLGRYGGVIGGSIALDDRKVLFEYFDQITIVERDRIKDHPAIVKPVPQSNHFPALSGARKDDLSITVLDGGREMTPSALNATAKTLAPKFPTHTAPEGSTPRARRGRSLQRRL